MLGSTVPQNMSDEGNVKSKSPRCQADGATGDLNLPMRIHHVKFGLTEEDPE